MKKIPAIVLMSILLFNNAGFYVYCIININRHHQAMEAAIRSKDEQLTRLSFTKNEFELASVHDEEISFEGKMYDIGRIQIKADSVIIFALHDVWEDNLRVLMNELMSLAFSPEDEICDFVLANIALTYLSPDSPLNFSAGSVSIMHACQFITRSNSDFPITVDHPPKAA